MCFISSLHTPFLGKELQFKYSWIQKRESDSKEQHTRLTVFLNYENLKTCLRCIFFTHLSSELKWEWGLIQIKVCEMVQSHASKLNNFIPFSLVILAQENGTTIPVNFQGNFRCLKPNFWGQITHELPRAWHNPDNMREKEIETHKNSFYSLFPFLRNVQGKAVKGLFFLQKFKNTGHNSWIYSCKPQ